MGTPTRLTTDEAARRLGIKPATLYAYVSRGVLHSAASPNGKQRTFSATDIEALAQRGRPRQASRSHALDFTIDTAITSITQNQLTYRGYDATKLCSTATYEQVAGLLLEGTLRPHTEWPTGQHNIQRQTIPQLNISQLNIPQGLDVFDHIALVTILAGSADPLANDLSPTSVAHTARNLISAVVGSWPALGDGQTRRLTIADESFRSTIAGRLWCRLSPRRPAAGMVEILNAALVLLADHELAVSAVTARVTASTRANPYAVISAAVAAMSGPLHGGAVRPARRMIEDGLRHMGTGARGDARIAAERAASNALETFGAYPGFGHKVYKAGDPRADALLAMLRQAAGGSKELLEVDALITAIARRRDIRPNIDLALAAFSLVAGLPEHAGQIIFTLARIAGWSAHAIEEYAEAPLRYRARAVFIG